jgi:hypothetical protein
LKGQKAVGEFAVIVLGVLAALLAESYVTDVRDASEADGYRVRLTADLAADVKNLDEVAAYFGRMEDSGATVLEWIDTGRTDLTSTDLFVQVVFASSLQPTAIARDTWDDLVNNGKLALLDEDERTALSYFYRTSETFLADLSDIPEGYRMAILGQLPVDPVSSVFEQCVLYESLAPKLPPCEADFGWDPSPVLADLRTMLGLREDLRRAMHSVRIQMDFAAALSDHARTVAEEVGRKGSA